MLELPYLAVKNWSRFQGSSNTARRPWVKDYVDKEADSDFASLTMFQRALLDGLCRLRGRLGKNLPNEPKYIARALCTMPEERHCIAQALRKLVARGFLIPCNQQDDSIEERRVEENRGEERQKTATDCEVVSTIKLDPPPKPIPNSLTVHQLAKGLLTELEVPGNNHDLAIVVDALNMRAAKMGSSLTGAYEFILAKALDARDAGTLGKPIFWIKDGAYNSTPQRSRNFKQESDDAALAEYKRKMKESGAYESH